MQVKMYFKLFGETHFLRCRITHKFTVKNRASDAIQGQLAQKEAKTGAFYCAYEKLQITRVDAEI